MVNEIVDGYELFHSDTELGKALRESFSGKVKTIDIHIEVGELVTVTTVELIHGSLLNVKTWKSVLSKLELVDTKEIPEKEPISTSYMLEEEDKSLEE